MGKIFEALEKTKQSRKGAADAVEAKPISGDEIISTPLSFEAEDEQAEHGLESAPAIGYPPAANREDKPYPVTRNFATKPTFDKGKMDPRLVVLFDPQSFEAEQFRMLRTNILFPSNRNKPARSIIVTSVAPNEGKSFTAANLALTIAQNIDKHVLLIDCDMRRPCIHSMMGFDQVKGLSDHLTENIPLAELLLKGPGERLTILPGGTIPPNPSELLSSNRMGALLREVKDRYSDRFIIIDSPPPQLTSEASALMHQVDAVLLIFRMNYSDKTAAKELVEKLGRDRFIGVVANQAPVNEIAYYGRGKYGKYKNYYHSEKS